MPSGLRHRAIRPENCFFGVGIPTTEDDFERQRHDRSPRFAKKYQGTIGRTQYRDEVIRPFSRCTTHMRRLGVHVQTRLTIDQLWRQFFEKGIHAVVLFSHWGLGEGGEDAVELYSGFVPVATLVDGISREAKVIDLCVCHPNSLINEILARRPNLTVRCNPERVTKLDKPGAEDVERGLTPGFWLYFYSTLFRYLKSGRFTYVEAHKRLILRALEMARASGGGFHDRKH